MLKQHFQIYGYAFSFTSNIAYAAKSLGRLFADYGTMSPPADEHNYRITINPDSTNGLVIQTPHTAPRSIQSLDKALQAVEAAITNEICRFEHGLHVIHGGVVYGSDGDLLLIGHSGAGKTSLCLALATRGFTVGGDDMAILDPHRGVLRPHPRCFHIDKTSASMLKELGLKLHGNEINDEFIIPQDLGLRQVRCARLRLVIVLEPERLRRPRLIHQTQAEATAAVLIHTGRGNFTDLEAVQAIASLASQVQFFRLWSGSLAATADAVLEVASTGQGC